MSDDICEMLDHVYDAMDGNDLAQEYSRRHRIESAAILTIYNDEIANEVAGYLADRITGKTVIEVGGGIGLLAFHLSLYAKHVYCIEANPMWSWTFASCLLARKPINVSYLFGAAREFTGIIRGDVALFCTHSDAIGMKETATEFAPDVIDVYGELMPGELPIRSMKRGETLVFTGA